ncbi:MAG: c-type cytochrome domain-containing protein, partial [Planctomycetaceae bacterium]
MKPHVLVLLGILFGPRPVAAAERVEFARDVLPILSANCFPCHGPDEHDRQAGLRLDVRIAIALVRKSGVAVGRAKPEERLFWQRLVSPQPDRVVPPPWATRLLTPAQIAG